MAMSDDEFDIAMQHADYPESERERRTCMDCRECVPFYAGERYYVSSTFGYCRCYDSVIEPHEAFASQEPTWLGGCWRE